MHLLLYSWCQRHGFMMTSTTEYMNSVKREANFKAETKLRINKVCLICRRLCCPNTKAKCLLQSWARYRHHITKMQWWACVHCGMMSQSPHQTQVLPLRPRHSSWWPNLRTPFSECWGMKTPPSSKQARNRLRMMSRQVSKLLCNAPCILASYSESVGLRCGSGDRFSLLRDFLDYVSPSTIYSTHWQHCKITALSHFSQMTRQNLKSGHDGFLPLPLQLIIP
jgi:hypothetical protein